MASATMNDESLIYPPGLPDDVSPLGERADPLIRNLAIVVGILGVALLIGAFVNPHQFYFSYLFGYTFALDISLGALFWVLIHHVSDAGWSVGMRRVYENITRALFPLAVLFIPILFGISTDYLHPWHTFITNPQPEGHEAHVWEVKSIWFATPFFLARIVLYFAVWLHYSYWMRRWSVQQDAVGGAVLTRKMQWWAPSGILTLALTSTFFAFDILMSLQYTWFSTIFGVYFWVGGIRGSLSACVLIVFALRAKGYLTKTITREHLHDAAKLMFGLTVFWAYIGFSQYFLIWYGNMPEETQYYMLRRNGTWYPMSILLPIMNFVVPFFLLLPRANKRNAQMLAFASAWILAMHSYDLYWQIMPVLHPKGIDPHPMDFAMPLFFAGVVGLSVLWGLKRVALIPIRDARLNETIGYENETP